MRKEEFLERLENALIMDAPEKEDVLRYYAEYLEEAGEENVEAVLEEIGSPEELGSRLSAEFYEEEKAREPEATDAPWEDMVKDIGSAVERFLKKALRTTGAAVDEVTERLGAEWKKSEGSRSEAGREINKAVEDAKRVAREGVKEASKMADDGLRYAKKALTSLKDILEEGSAEPFEYTDFDLEPFHSLQIAVKNCPVTLHASQNTCYGVDVRIPGGSAEDISVTVENDTLNIRSSGSGWSLRGSTGLGGRSIHVYLPEGVYDSLDVTTTNGRIEAEGLMLEDAEVNLKTRNAKIRLTDCRMGTSLQAQTGNCPVELEEVSVTTALLYTVNAPIKVTGGSIGAVNADTSNGSISLQGCSINRKLTAETANGAVRLNLPETQEQYRVTADTSNAAVVVNGEKQGEHYESPGRIPVLVSSDNGRIELTFGQPPCVYEAEYTEEE